MAWHRAYYSVIQYCPDLGRLEAANIGLVLFCPELQYLRAQFSRSNQRIVKFFGRDKHDWKRINAFKKGLEHRILNSAEEIRDKESFIHFIAMQANLMQLTPPLACKVSSKPDVDLERMFDEIVTVEQKKTTPLPKIRQALEHKFSRANVSDRLLRNVKVVVPVLNREIEIPFGFQNGRFNLIAPVRFETDSASIATRTACQYAVEGRSLYEKPDDQLGKLQLYVVGKFKKSDSEAKVAVERVLTENCVKLYKFEEVPNLVDDIRRTGKVQYRNES